MKRSPAIASLSRDHHQALFVAQELRRATDETAGEARGAALAYWDEHGREHFRLEERQLFALIEETLPAADLAAVATALDHAEHGHA